MFGYITVNKQEMKFKDFDIYQSFYCGFCKELKDRFGRAGQLSVSYDMTFLLILLTALYDSSTTIDYKRCVVHPIEKQCMRQSPYTSYVADLNILLTYYKSMDDWLDEKKHSSRMYARILKKRVDEITHRLPHIAEVLENNLQKMSYFESEKLVSIDRMAGLFGEIMGEMFVYQPDEWQDSLYKVGFYLGKFIYLLDAYDDVVEDKKEGNYNPYLSNQDLSYVPHYGDADFDDKCQELLVLMMAECSKSFEKLPIIEYTDILRNVLYSGVWTKYYQIRLVRNPEKR